ncbi:NAD(P)H-dependent flavin oxidoreductase [Brevundimonas vesicularis]|uniref:NAD(P)H-dependent flavin oxidoreductase n=1 Tax=Brevundimonas vesicularis TaxID=41276 RepID=UPI0038D44988
MFSVTGPDLVRECCLAGIVGGLPRHNARSLEEFEHWLASVRDALNRRRETHPDARIGAIAVNMASNLPPQDFEENLEVCRRHGVEIIINATGNPTELTRRAHDKGFLVYADAVNLRFAEKAMAVGVDGINAIGAGGGGHSGRVSHLALVAAIRARFDKTVLMGGALSSGSAIRAAEVLGADLAFMGTRFIATREAAVPDAYKAMLVEATSADLVYTARFGGAPANWLAPSLAAAGLDPLDEAGGLPAGSRPWWDVWSAGQGVDQIHDLPEVADLVDRLVVEYELACQVPRFSDRLIDAALSAPAP